MSKKEFKRLASSGVEVVDLIAYSKEAFLKFGLGSEDDFYNMDFVENMAYEYFENLKDASCFKKVRFPLIDDRYFEYLEANNLEDTDEIRIDYASNLSDEECEEYWKDAEMNISLDWGVLPITMVNGNMKISKNNFTLSNSSIEKIKPMIVKAFNDAKTEDGNKVFDITLDDIYVSPIIVDMDWFKYYEEQIGEYEEEAYKVIDEATALIQNCDYQIDTSISRQDFEDGEVIKFYGIFFMYKYKTPAIFTREYFENMKYRRVDIPTLNIDTMEKILKKDIKKEFQILTECFVYPEDFSDVVEELINLVSEVEESKQQNIKKLFNTIDNHTGDSSNKPVKKHKRNTNF